MQVVLRCAKDVEGKPTTYGLTLERRVESGTNVTSVLIKGLDVGSANEGVLQRGDELIAIGGVRVQGNYNAVIEQLTKYKTADGVDAEIVRKGIEWTAGYAWHGWLGKRHQHANRLGGQWAQRYFSINACGTFSYAKNEVARPKVELPLCDVTKVTPVEGDFSWGFIISCPPVHLTVRADSLADRNRWIAGLIHHSRLWREKNGQIVRVATVATRGAGAVPGANAVPPKDEETYTERSADVTQTRGSRGANAPPRPPPADEEKVSGPWTLDCDEYENMAQLLTPLGRGEGPRLSKRRTAMDRSAGAVPNVQDGSSHFDRHAEAAQSRRARRAAELARAPAADGDGDGRQPAAVDDVKQTQSAAIRRNQRQSEANGNQTQSDDDERWRNERSSLKHAADAYAASAISADEVCIVDLLTEDDDDDDDDKLVSHRQIRQPHRDVWG